MMSVIKDLWIVIKGFFGNMLPTFLKADLGIIGTLFDTLKAIPKLLITMGVLALIVIHWINRDERY